MTTPSEILALIGQMQDAIAVTAASDDVEASPVLNQLYGDLSSLLKAREIYLQTTGQPATALDPSLQTRARQFDLLRSAVGAFRVGDHEASARRAIGAYALDPGDWHSETLLKQAVAYLAGHTDSRDRAVEGARFQPPSGSCVDGARSFICLTDADEILASPQMLAAWARTFEPRDDATLVILVNGDRHDETASALVAALQRSGVGDDTELDLAVVDLTPGTDAELAREAHAALTDRAGPLDGAFGGIDRFSSDPAGLAALRSAAEDRWRCQPPGRRLRIAIKIPPRDWSDAITWGDTFFALQFARELTRRGHQARLDVLPEWDINAAGDDVVIHLRGPFPYAPDPNCFNVLWNISRPSRVTAAECDAFDLVAAPSARRATELAAVTSTPVIVLPQATDPANCFPEVDPAFTHDLVFVANTRGVYRQIIRDLLPTDRDLAVWGQGWHGLVPEECIIADSLPNNQLRRAYSSGRIVLNDHMADQATYGIVNNRIYDVLACGGCVVSDYLPEIEEVFGDIVATYDDPAGLSGTIERLLSDPAERAERGVRGRELVLQAHTFGHRAQTLLATVAKLG